MFIIFDTEYTSWEGTNEKGYNRVTQFPEIVQISAIKVDDNFKIIDKFNVYVKPIINPKLSKYFINLTKISQNKINKDGISLVKALNLFYIFCKNNGKCIDIYSYGNDYNIIKEDLDINNIKDNKFKTWKNNFYDVKNIFEDYGINTTKYTSGTVYKSLHIKPTSKINIHDAEWDTYSIYITLKKIYNKYV